MGGAEIRVLKISDEGVATRLTRAEENSAVNGVYYAEGGLLRKNGLKKHSGNNSTLSRRKRDAKKREKAGLRGKVQIRL